MIARVVFAAACGAACGSFAALVADRIPRGESIVTGRSKCRSCDRSLGARDLVPIVSWTIGRGRCRMCGTAIGTASLFVEFLMSVLFVVCAVRFDDLLTVGAHWVLCVGLMILSVIDVFTMKLPRRIIHSTFAVGFPLLGAASISIDQPWRVSMSLMGALGALVAMGLLFVASAGRLGDGDVRLSPLLGLYLGWKSGSAVFSGFFLSFLLGAIVGVGLMIVRPPGSTRAIPFGPFLAIGTMSTLLYDIDFLGPR